MTGQEIVNKALEYVGTPWHHTGRVKHIGIDCAGLIVCTLRELGAVIEDETRYTMDDEFAILNSKMHEYCDEATTAHQGDILIFRGRLMYNHCGFYNNGRLIHAYSSPSVMKVVETTIDSNWIGRLYGIYRFRGVK